MKKTLIIGIVMVMVMGLAGMASAYVIQGNAAVHGIGTFTISTANSNAPTAMNDASGSQQWFVLPGAVGENTGVAGTLYYRMYKSPGPAAWTFKAFVEDATADPSMTVNIWGASASAVADLVGKTWELKVGGVSKQVETWDAAHVSAGAPMFSYTWADTSGMVGVANAVTVTLGEVVPEPGSMVAMLSGLVGLVGFGIRRRK
jgi:hypothetical protein